MMEVDVTEAAPRFAELLEAAQRGEEVVITQAGERFAITPLQPPLDVEAHLVAIRRRLAGKAPPPTAAELDAEVAAMRGRA